MNSRFSTALRRAVVAMTLVLTAGLVHAQEQASEETLKQGWQVFNRTCTVCHWPGVGGAPRIGDKVAWAPRIAAGTDILYRHAIRGWEDGGSGKTMPARGGNWTLTDEEVRAAVDYIIHNSR